MNYVAFFAIIVPLQLMLIVTALRFISLRRVGAEADGWMTLTSKVFGLLLVVNVVALLPGIGLAAAVIWLVGLKRLSGLDILSTFILAFTLGVVSLAGMVVLAKYLEVPFLRT